jgi:hypothetical protein
VACRVCDVVDGEEVGMHAGEANELVHHAYIVARGRSVTLLAWSLEFGHTMWRAA